MRLQGRGAGKLDALSRVPLFEGCSKRELSVIAALADELDVSEGSTLIWEGDRGREFFVILEGEAHVARGDRRLRDLGAGDWAGEIALLTGLRRTATVVTASPVRLVVLTDRAFRSALAQIPSMEARLTAAVQQRLKASAA
jgi:CRP-like cAMP-binding protein